MAFEKFKTSVFGPHSIIRKSLNIEIPYKGRGQLCNVTCRWFVLLSPPQPSVLPHHRPLTPPPLCPPSCAHLSPPSNLSQAPPAPSLSPLFDTLRVAGELPSVFHLPLSHLSHSLPADPPTQRVLTIQTRGPRSSVTTASQQQGACQATAHTLLWTFCAYWPLYKQLLIKEFKKKKHNHEHGH